jgi:hypothetical protein
VTPEELLADYAQRHNLLAEDVAYVRQLLADARRAERARCLAEVREQVWYRPQGGVQAIRERSVREIVEAIKEMGE